MRTPTRRAARRGARIPASAAACFVLLGAVRTQQPPPGPRAVPPPLGDDLAELREQSAWRQDARYEGDEPDKSRRGVYPVGNGHVFTYMGLGRRANTMQALTGPRYQTQDAVAPDGQFGELTVELSIAGSRVALPEQRVRRVRGAAFVVTEDASAELSLRTLTFAEPDTQIITRVIEVVNTKDEPIDGLELVVDADRFVQNHGEGTRAAGARIRLSGPDGSSALSRSISRLEPGGAWRSVLRVVTEPRHLPSGAVAANSEQRDNVAIEAATRSARRTLDWWRQKLEPTTFYDTDDLKVRDLIGDWKVLMLVLRDAESGAVVGMVNRRVAGVRASNGAMLALLRFKMWDEAKGILRYFFDATRLLGRVPEEVPLDLDLAALADRVTDWEKVEVPGSEIPSWVILQHFWYWRATQDTELIQQHWPLIDVCMKRQKREQDSLMSFAGSEPYAGGVLYRLSQAALGTESLLVGHDPAQGRRSYSLVSSTLFLIAVQAVGEMLDGIDRAAHPEKYAGDAAAAARPGLRYTRRAFGIMVDIERRFWMPEAGMFAPAVSPVDGTWHPAPVANANLMPLWVGWTFPTGEKSRDNLKNSLAQLWLDGARIGTTATLGYTTGDLQGMLLVALSERDGRRRLDVLDRMLAQAEPAGEWGEVYGPDGRPCGTEDPRWPNRLRPGESGVNLDAMLFALTGIRYASVPNWDNNDIRLEFRLPRGASWFTAKDVVKDGRALNLFFRRTRSALDEDERKQNDELVPDKRRDPNAVYERMRFVVDLLSGNPQKGYYDVAINAAGTVFVRYLKPDLSGDQDLRRIEEVEFWKDDELEFLPTGPSGPRAAPTRAAVQPAANALLLVLTNRKDGAEIVRGPGVTVFDTALPFDPDDLAALLVDAAGKPVHQRLLLDWHYDAGPPASFTDRAFWHGDAFARLLDRYRAAGGAVLAPAFLERIEVLRGAEWQAATAAGGRVRLEGGGPRRVRFTVSSDSDREAVLHLGTGCSFDAQWNGEEILGHGGPRHPLPDQDSQLIRLRAGQNVLEVELRDDGVQELMARLTDAQGLPIRGLQ